MMKNFLYLSLFLICAKSIAQNSCTTLGQKPNTAFPVCGTVIFNQNTVPNCTGASIPVPACAAGSGGYNDVTPFWYKFTCFQSGTLGFLIQPISTTDDYDWQIFDVTSHDPTDVYTNPLLFVSCNWSSNPGATGTSASGTSLNGCAGPTYPNISSMPGLQIGHDYLLLVSNFSPSQLGYKLSFSGGTASITDTLPPKLANADAACDGTKMGIKLNKKMKCKTLAADGSDFSINTAVTSIVAAVGNNCTTGFDMDSIIITLNNPIPPGNYILTAKNGSDGNTLLDNCDNAVPVGDKMPVTVYPNFPTPMDSLTKAMCAPKDIVLVFNKFMRCNSIALDGSDFIVTGPTIVNVAKAVGSCNSDGLTKTITVTLLQAIKTAGTYTITLKTGNDGNTIFNECGKETPIGSSLQFTTVDTVSAIFNYNIGFGCSKDTISFTHPANGNVNKWDWDFGDGKTSSLQSPTLLFFNTGTQIIKLKVNNGFCFDSATQAIILDYDTLKAMFEVPQFICPTDIWTINNTSTGKINSYTWDFGNGTKSVTQNPATFTYPTPTIAQKKYSIRLTVTNAIGCSNTAIQDIVILKSCYIAVPTAFTPNGDGINDFLYPLNASKADHLEFKIYNRYGNLIFETTDWTKKWDGKIDGVLQPSGTYVWQLNYINHDTNKQVSEKGTTVLIR